VTLIQMYAPVSLSDCRYSANILECLKKYNCKILGAVYSCTSNAVSDDTKILSCDRFLKNMQIFVRSFFVECGFSNEHTKSDCFEDLGIAGGIKLKCCFKK